MDHIGIFKRWVYYQIKSDSKLQLSIMDTNTYRIDYKKRYALFSIWNNMIVEESIYEDGELIFHLFYPFDNYGYATYLYRSMYKQLIDDEEKVIRVVIACTGGMTSTFFKERMNTYLSFQQTPYKIDAMSIEEALDEYYKFDLLLLAPQVQYHYHDLVLEYPHLLIHKINPVIFGTYDCAALLEEINTLMEEHYDRSV